MPDVQISQVVSEASSADGVWILNLHSRHQVFLSSSEGLLDFNLIN